MSRIGKLPVPIPEGATLEQAGHRLTAKGPKGELSLEIRSEIEVRIEGGQVLLRPKIEDRMSRGLYGLSRTLVANQLRGVTEGFQKSLEIQGVGYRAAVQGRRLVLSLGYSHPIEYDPPAGIEISVEKNIITVSGASREVVGQVAAEIRSFRPPEPYKGKGVRYRGEHVRRKAGKAGKAAA